MGTVYKATHIHLGVDRVIKIMRGVVDDRSRDRFAREAQLAARIHVPTVATLYDFGIDARGFFTVWEYVPGVTLAAVLRQVHRVHWRVMIVVGGQLLSALRAVHDAGILHRDIAPSNIMLYRTDDGVLETKLIDFGIAKEALAPMRDRELTAEGLFVGTPRYAAPEQITMRETDARSDLYSAAVVMYQMIVGTVPFQADTTINEVLRKLNEPVVALPSELWETPDDPLPRELEQVIVRALSRDPHERYETAEEFLDEMWAVASPQYSEIEEFTDLVESLYSGARDQQQLRGGDAANEVVTGATAFPNAIPVPVELPPLDLPPLEPPVPPPPPVPTLASISNVRDIATGLFRSADFVAPLSAPIDRSEGTTLANVRLLPVVPSEPLFRKIREGTQMGGYTVERLVGEGPHGAVFLARNPASLLDRQVALKVPHSQRLDAAELEILQHDVKVWSFLSAQQYPGVLRLHEATRHEDLAVLVIDYFDGESLTAVLERVAKNGPLPLSEAVPVIRAICEALEPLHRKNLHHGNLKPANVLLQPGGGVKLTDFMMRDREAAHADETPYLAPEVGEAAGSPRADVYAIGAMLYELLHATTGAPWAVSESYPYPVERLLQRCLADDPKRRFESASEVLTDIALIDPAQDLVTRLASSIREHAAPADLDEILNQLAQQGNPDSTAETLLLEYCLSADPGEVLTTCLSGGGLRRLARALGVRTDDKVVAPIKYVDGILEKLGFHRRREPSGIGQTLAALAKDRDALPRLDDRNQIIGTVTTAAGEYERVMKEVIRFHAYVVYGGLYDDVLFAQMNKPMARMTMGDLRTVLQKLNKMLAAGGRDARYFASVFKRDHIVPPELLTRHNLAALRNAFIHSGESRDTPLHDLRDKAEAILSAIDDTFRTLDRESIYPRIVVVQSFETDRFGRRYVVCTSDRGIEERIYTGIAVEPAREYFFHPTTTPVRIYPILVPRT